MKIIRYLIAADCDVNIQGPEGMTVLHMAAMRGDTDVCDLLLNEGRANVDPRDHGGWTPLVWAAEHKHVRTVRLLLSKGANALAKDLEGNGAIHWCALAGDSNVLKLLLDAAPLALHQTNAHQDTPL
ncbi:unnamed protein product [Diatraea saccharalis]|uniref:Ankyrin repeat protein n=1 Tax=Diatraea saccharalis TaxID=40085 RepID=A0A9N9QU27_9NEOP|nr:unnamed protein product [Diatraea saccharalis]